MAPTSSSLKSSSKKTSSASYPPPCPHVPKSLDLFPVKTSPIDPQDFFFQQCPPILISSFSTVSSGTGSNSVINHEQEGHQDYLHHHPPAPKRPRLIFEIASPSLPRSSATSSSSDNIDLALLPEIDDPHGLDLTLSLATLSYDLRQLQDQQDLQVAAAADDDQDDRDQGRYNIRKTLEKSDVNQSLGRLLLGRQVAETHVLSVLSDREVEDVKSGRGTQLLIRDMDHGTDHLMTFKKHTSSKSYVFNRDWTRQFLKRRQLRAGDTIGMYWDTEARRFCFSLLRRVLR